MTSGRDVRRVASVAANASLLWLAARCVAPRVDRAQRRVLSAALAKRLLAGLEVRVRVHGDRSSPEAPELLVANHVSWLDVYVLNAIREARFVAKSETRGWPLVGIAAARFDSLFIVRGSIRDAARVERAIAAALRAGDSVAFFPEGTTSDGTRLRRFHPALFQAAVDAGTTVRPIAIRYPLADGAPNPAVPFVGDMTFVESLVRVARAPTVAAEVTFLPPLRGDCRRQLASRAQRLVAEALALPWDVVEPPKPLGSRFAARKRPATAA
jgi:1-acyl-sn-glycerol-3-phosphate acyltransferase